MMFADDRSTSGMKNEISVNYERGFPMFVAVSAEGQALTSPVSAKFEECKYVLIVNMDNMDVETIENIGMETDLAQKIIDCDCEASITGELSSQTFEMLADACVTRYYGYGHTAKEAIVLMERYALKLIRNVDMSDDCLSEQTEGSCDGHHSHT